MQFKNLVLATLVAATQASPVFTVTNVEDASPAELEARDQKTYKITCYEHSDNGGCVSRADMWNFRDDYCNEIWWINGKSHQYTGIYKHKATFSPHMLPGTTECWDTTKQIIDTCYGSKNGGRTSGTFIQNLTNKNITFTMDVNFCG